MRALLAPSSLLAAMHATHGFLVWYSSITLACQHQSTAAEVTDYLPLRACSGIVVGGEYGLTAALLRRGHNVATLMSRYARDVDWRQPLHWHCNNNAHPSRHGTYGPGTSLHPFETLFVKSSWHVGDPYTSPYSQWTLAHLRGQPGTGATRPRACMHARLIGLLTIKLL